jgi:hypothetical protein
MVEQPMLAGLGAGASERSNEQSTIIKSKRQGARTTATPRARRRRSDRTRRHKSRRAPRPRGAGAGAYRTGSTGRCASSPRTPPFVCLDEAGAVAGSGRAQKRTARGRTRGLRGVRWDSEKVSRRAVARAYVYVLLQNITYVINPRGATVFPKGQGRIWALGHLGRGPGRSPTTNLYM